MQLSMFRPNWQSIFNQITVYIKIFNKVLFSRFLDRFMKEFGLSPVNQIVKMYIFHKGLVRVQDLKVCSYNFCNKSK